MLPALFFACSETAEEPAESSDQQIDEVTTEEPQPGDPDYVDPSVVNSELDTNLSLVVWSRYKKVKNANMSIGNFSMSVGEAEFTTDGDFPVESGYWQVIDGKNMMLEAILDLTRVAALQINDENKLDVVSPNYLNTDEYPSAMLLFKSFEENPAGNEHACTLELTLKGKTQAMDAIAVFDWTGAAPSTMSCTFTIDGVAWGLINPDVDADIEKDEFTLDCTFNIISE